MTLPSIRRKPKSKAARAGESALKLWAAFRASKVAVKAAAVTVPVAAAATAWRKRRSGDKSSATPYTSPHAVPASAPNTGAADHQPPVEQASQSF